MLRNLTSGLSLRDPLIAHSRLKSPKTAALKDQRLPELERSLQQVEREVARIKRDVRRYNRRLAN